MDIDQITDDTIAAQNNAGLIEPWSARYPSIDLETAYLIASRIDEHRRRQGWVPAGRKIGFTNREMWSLYGVEYPIWGRLYHHRVVDLSQSGNTVALAGLAQPMLEPEVVFHFDQVPAPDSGPDQVLDCIDWIAGGFEVVQSHYPDWRFEAADTVIDNGLHGLLLLGPRLRRAQFGGWEAVELEQFSVDLTRDGLTVHQGRGTNVLGGPQHALRHLLGLLTGSVDKPRLAAGEMVTTGTLTPAVPIAPGQTWRVRFSDIELAEIAVTFEPRP